MKKFASVLGTAVAGCVLATGFVAAAPVQAEMTAGPFDKIKKGIKKAKKKAREAEQAAAQVEAVANEVERARQTNGRSVVNGVAGAASGNGLGREAAVNQAMRQRSNYPKTAKRPGHAGVAAATPAKYTQMTKCANLGIGNAFVGRDGDYTFQQGISTEERGGIIDRRDIAPTSGCLFEGLGVGDVLYVEFDRNKFSRHKYAIQCVSYDGSEQQDNVFGPSVSNYAGKDIMLHDGNSLGYTPTASGSNSSRSGAYDKYMKSRGRDFAIINFKGRHDDKAGTDFYCQWFDKASGESALALTYRRGPTGG